jgi:small subunit ribosomal protein S6e
MSVKLWRRLTRSKERRMNIGICRGDLLEFKVIISEGGKTYQKEIKGDEAARLVGLRIGEVFDGGLIGESGQLQITGGTDRDGFPMRRGIPGSRRLKILVRGGSGFIPRTAGERRKKMVRGDTICEETVQINTKVIAVKGEKKKVTPEGEAEEVKVEEEVKEVKEKKVKKKEKVEEVKVEEEVKEVKEKKVKKKEKVEEEKAEKEPEVKEEPGERAIPLTKVKGIGKKTSDLLITAGVSSVQEFLQTDTAKLAKKTGMSTAKLEKMKADAQELMG